MSWFEVESKGLMKHPVSLKLRYKLGNNLSYWLNYKLS